MSFENEDAVRAGIAAVRSDADPSNWVAVTFATPQAQKLTLIGSGDDGVDTVLKNIRDDNIVFALFRLTDKIDESVTVKFLFLAWIGTNVARMQKARLSTQRGAIEQFFRPYHADITTSDLSEVTWQFFLAKVMDLSGTASRVKEDGYQAPAHAPVHVPVQPAYVPAAQPQPQAQSQPQVQRQPARAASSGGPSVPKSIPKEKSLLVFDDEGAIRAAIQDVRLNNRGIDWALVQHHSNNHLSLVAQGSGNIDALTQHLNPSSVFYALVRKTEKFDESITVKFAFVYWVGESVAPMFKGRISTTKGEIDALFHPWHVDLLPTRLDEISDQIIVDKIGKTSGTKSSVLE